MNAPDLSDRLADIRPEFADFGITPTPLSVIAHAFDAGLDETTGNGGTLSSLNSYVYNGGDSMYGPKFGSSTQTTYAAADSAASNTIAP